MTDRSDSTDEPTAAGRTSEQSERIAELKRRRAGSAQPPAGASKVAVAGFGVAGMLGLVAAMGYANRSEPPAEATPTPIVVVLRTDAASGSVTVDGSAVEMSTVAPAAGTEPPLTSAPPLVLEAQPTVRSAPAPAPPLVLEAQPAVRPAPAAAAAPRAQTNGSN